MDNLIKSLISVVFLVLGYSWGHWAALQPTPIGNGMESYPVKFNGYFIDGERVSEKTWIREMRLGPGCR
jgi:hypothetical protein